VGAGVKSTPPSDNGEQLAGVYSDLQGYLHSEKIARHAKELLECLRIRAEEMRMQPALFDTVELLVDLPAYNLRLGSLGAIVHAYDARNYEVEFINAEGKTTALCPLSIEQFIVVCQAKT
jgi:hypothetical protein